VSDRLQLRSEGLEWREIEGEIVALDRRSSRYLAVNRTGTALWPALREGATREELIGRLVSAYDVDEETAGRDLDAFLAALRERDLLAQ
jgi:hypothetical protein